MTAPYIAPKFQEKVFNCPRCGAYAAQAWFRMLGIADGTNFQRDFDSLYAASCAHCRDASYWIDGKQVAPNVRQAPAPNPDMAADIIADYEEAALIQNVSPRGSAALLRLCVQKLCVQIGEKGVNINEDIASLVSKGLPVAIKQALDVVRVVGNNAVHPGQMNVEEGADTVRALFLLINSVAERMITMPKQVQELHAGLPQSVLEAIRKRDAKSTNAIPKG